MSNMIGVRDLEEIVETVIWTAYVEGEKPVSLLLASRVEGGKTRLLLQYTENKGIERLDDMTAWALTSPSRAVYQRLLNNQTHHIVCPDLLRPLSRNRDTVNTLITFLLGLIEEGTMAISTYATNLALKEPLLCGLITGIAKEELHIHRHQWMRVGFLSRLLPVSWEYSPGTQAGISHSIAKREYIHYVPVDLSLPDRPLTVFLPPEISYQLEILAPLVINTQKEAERLYGFRLQRQLQAFTMAHALRAGRDTVLKEDYERTAQLSNFWNLNYNAL